MFDTLSERLQGALGDVRSRGKLTEDDVKKAMRQVRLALLEADVNFKVVKEFTDAVRERALGEQVLESLNPGQQVVKIVNDELARLMGGAGRELAFAKQGGQAGATVYEQGTGRDPVDIAEWALDQAKHDRRDALIVDTSGRLHIDEQLMNELANVKKRVKPHNVLLVVDAMTGQDAVNVAESFAEVAQFDGVVLTKLDGDARGGAALSVRAVTGKPVIYASMGEKLGDFERFHPDRMAQRILGMGDVLSFIEKAEQQVDEDRAAEMEKRLKKGQFTFEDFLEQMKMMRKMGPLSSLLGMIPGMGAQLRGVKIDDRELDRIEAIVLSMTPEERRRPELIKGSRRRRIARGSGVAVQQVNQLVKQFGEMRKMMKGLSSGKMPDLGALMRQAR